MQWDGSDTITKIFVIEFNFQIWLISYTVAISFAVFGGTAQKKPTKGIFL